MRKVLVVDDEFLVRVGIKSFLNWEENGYTIIGEAADGKQAHARPGKSPIRRK